MTAQRNLFPNRRLLTEYAPRHALGNNHIFGLLQAVGATFYHPEIKNLRDVGITGYKRFPKPLGLSAIFYGKVKPVDIRVNQRSGKDVGRRLYHRPNQWTREDKSVAVIARSYFYPVNPVGVRVTAFKAVLKIHVHGNNEERGKCRCKPHDVDDGRGLETLQHKQKILNHIDIDLKG
jgi:hypothetical protein